MNAYTIYREIKVYCKQSLSFGDGVLRRKV